MHPAYTVEKRAATNMAQTGMSVEGITEQLRRQYGMGLYEASTIAQYAVEAHTAPQAPAYVTEDHVTVHEGDTVYDYYGMEVVIIGKPSGSDGWFDTLAADGSGHRSKSGMLNGSRICTMRYAARRGFPGAADYTPPK
jgi:hypothetical protein